MEDYTKITSKLETDVISLEKIAAKQSKIFSEYSKIF